MDTFRYPAKVGIFMGLQGMYLIAAEVSRVLILEGYACKSLPKKTSLKEC